MPVRQQLLTNRRIQISVRHWLVPGATGCIVGFRERTADGEPVENKIQVLLDKPYIERAAGCRTLYLSERDFTVEKETSV